MARIVWFKRDLRTHDHEPLARAAAAGPVIPLYVVEPDYWALPDTSRRQWLATRSALVELSARLEALGAPLMVRTGSVTTILADLHRTVEISQILAHEETGNLWTYRRDRAVKALCREAGIGFQEFSQTGLQRGRLDRDTWAARHERFMAEPLVAEPARLAPRGRFRPSVIPTAEDLGLAPDGCDQPQSGERAEAWRLLESFVAGRGAAYRRGMSSPISARDCCSRLSTALAVGAVSMREVLQWTYQARRALAQRPAEERAIPITALDSLTARLHWRGHFMQKLESEPDLEGRAFHPLHRAARAPTAPDDPRLTAWAEGRTGYPFLDACMRSLVATGWLNFRMRAMVQAFASYHLDLDWRASGARLARLFTDYEPGIHWPQVQMQSGQTGINTPRIYNPVKQGLDQDPEGHFTRQWIPELARVPLAYLQTPWRLDAAGQAEAGIWIGRDYPAPIVDHEEAARAARARLTALRGQPGYGAAARQVFERHGSRKRHIRDDNPSRTKARAVAAKPPKSQLSFDF